MCEMGVSGVRYVLLVYRGYWARSTATRALSDAFGSVVGDGWFNVVNVGCGYDMIGFYVMEWWVNVWVVEVDYEEVMKERRARSEASAGTAAAAASEVYDLWVCDV